MIKTEHLLLGILRKDPNGTGRFLASKTTEEIRAEVEKGLVANPPISTTVDVLLSRGSERILAFALEEAEVLGHRHADVEHLLLGMLREENGIAGQILRSAGLIVWLCGRN